MFPSLRSLPFSEFGRFGITNQTSSTDAISFGFFSKTFIWSCTVLQTHLPRVNITEGQFTYWKSVRDFFRAKGFIRIFDGFFLKTKGFLSKVYEIFWSEMPLEHNRVSRSPSLHCGRKQDTIKISLVLFCDGSITL